MPDKLKKSDLKEAGNLLEEARKLADDAEEELAHGTEALSILMEYKTPEFKVIAEWHYRRCMEKAGLARKKFLESGKRSDNSQQRKLCDLKVTEIDKVFLKANESVEKVSKKSRKTVIGRGNKKPQIRKRNS